ncbi:MAG: 2-oxoacid:acceptor oxidoreductase family protein [Elusimicrobiota bacterium]
MKEIIIHARAGQGAITTAALLGDAVVESDKYAYVFPSFGAARMGAPMNAFIRLDEKPIRLRSQVKEPDYVIVIDETLLSGFNVFKGLKKNGVVIINTPNKIQPPENLHNSVKIITVPGNRIAEEILGRPLGNTAALGAFAFATKEFDLEALSKALKRRFSPKIAEKNLEMAKRGYEHVSGGK